MEYASAFINSARLQRQPFGAAFEVYRGARSVCIICFCATGGGVNSATALKAVLQFKRQPQQLFE